MTARFTRPTLLVLGSTLMLAVITSFVLGRDPQRFELPKDKPYVHKPSGFEFPVQVKSFTRRNGTQYDQNGNDISVDYIDRATRAWADVYVYPHHELSLEQEFRNVKDGINKAPIYRDVRVIEEGPYKLEQGKRVFLGMHGAFSYAIERNGNRDEMRSQAYVFVVGSNFIKFRVTYPAAQAEAAEKAIDAFVHELKLPESN
jgi:hypothetical protein